MDDQPPIDAPAANVPPSLPAITSAAEWRRKARACWLLTLPSGAVVKCRRPDFGRLIADGVIKPEDLLLDEQGSPRDRYNGIMPMARAVAPRVVVAPLLHGAEHLGDDADGVCVDDVPQMDLAAIFLWAGGWSAATPAVECLE